MIFENQFFFFLLVVAVHILSFVGSLPYTFCEISHPAKFRRLRNFAQPAKINFAGCEIFMPASHYIKILIKTAKINMKKLRKFAEK